MAPPPPPSPPPPTPTPTTTPQHTHHTPSTPPTWALEDRPAGLAGTVVSRCTTIAGEAALVPWVLAAVACNWLAPVSKVSARLNRPSPATVISPPLARPLTSS